MTIAGIPLTQQDLGGSSFEMIAESMVGVVYITVETVLWETSDRNTPDESRVELE